MKKNLFVVLFFVAAFLAWCSNNNVTKIDPEEWLLKNWVSVEQSFDNQVEEFQYVKDFEKYI